MKLTTSRYIIPLLISALPVAQADISLGKPTPDLAAHQGYHAELLSSNAVRAAFKEIRTIPVVKLDTAPGSEEVAVFEVKQNLAHRRYDRMGDGALAGGKLFSVSLGSDIPGQDAALGAKIRELQPGDEALLNMDHIYVFREDGNENVRSCTRFIKIAPQPAAQDPTQPAAADTRGVPAAALPAGQTGLPLSTTSRQVSTSITIAPDGQGGTRRMKVVEVRELLSNGQENVRKFINDVEVDPQTDQPLPLTPGAGAVPQPLPPVAAPQPAEQAEPQATTPQPEPRAASDATLTQPHQPTISAEDSF